MLSTGKSVSRIMCLVNCPPFISQFTADETVGSFSINYRLVAANIHEPQKGTVHVKLSLGEAQAPPVPGSEAEEWA